LRCVLEQGTLLSQCLSSPVYKWVPANLIVWVTLRSSYPGGSRNTPSHFMLQKIFGRPLLSEFYGNTSNIPFLSQTSIGSLIGLFLCTTIQNPRVEQSTLRRRNLKTQLYFSD